MTRAALDIVLNDPERYVMSDEEREAYERLALFFGRAAVDPGHFPLTGKSAARIKSIVRKAKGPAQPQSRRNKRKARQERRQSAQKRRRADNKLYREEYNEAMAKIRQDQEEAEAAMQEIQERIANEPKFAIYDGVGNLIMSEIPESAIRPWNDTESPENGTESKVILPGTAEALGLE